MQKILGLLIAAAALVIALLVGYQKFPSAPTPVELDPGAAATLEWFACDSYLYASMPVRCAHYFPGGESGFFAMPLAVFAYQGEDRQPDPLVYIAGGPGGGMETAPENLQGWVYWLEEAGLKRDLVIYDQRGLKPGKPYWDCERYNTLSVALLAEDVSLEQEYRATAAVLEECIREFDAWLKGPEVKAPEGIKSFSSTASARELTQMLKAAGYEQWNLWGVSYGSRVALVAAQQEPARTQALVLDSPYPLDKGNLTEKPAGYSRALERFWQVCEDNPDFCGVAVDDPEALYWRVVDKLSRQAKTYNIKLAGSSRAIKVELNEHRLFSLSLFALYDHRLYPTLLRALVYLDRAEAAEPPEQEQRDPVEFLLRLFVSSALDSDFNSFIFYAIECNDNPLPSVDSYRQAAQAEPALYQFTQWEGEYNPCDSPLFEVAGLVSPEPVPVAPALVLAGELDPVTPAEWADALGERLPRAEVKVVPRVGHAVFSSGGCEPALIEHYLEAVAQGGDRRSIIDEYCR